MRATWKVEGLRELGKALEGLTEATRRRVMRRALRRAAKPVEDSAKARAPVLKKPDPRRRPGTLRNAIRISSMGTKNPYGTAVKVGVRPLSGKSRRFFKSFKGRSGKALKGSENPNDPFYARFVEYGTIHAPAQPFMRPALESNRMRSVELMRDELKTGIEREARRQARRNRARK